MQAEDRNDDDAATAPAAPPIPPAGRDAIDAARHALSAARRWEASAAAALDAAETAAADARARLDTARDEARDAAARLEDVERRWSSVAADNGADDANDGADDGGSQARKKVKVEEGDDDRTVTPTQRSISPVGAPVGGDVRGGHVEFHIYAPPGHLGLVLACSSVVGNKLVVEVIKDDSRLSGLVKEGDVIVEFDGVNTARMDIETFRKLVDERKTLERKITFRRQWSLKL